VLKKHGVRKLDPEGAKFDPHRHQAMYEVPDESVPAGTIVQVVQPGYTIGERVLRPALVAIAKGGPKASPGEAADERAATVSANDNSTPDESPGGP
jgi:molecular chaperone GrpE